MREESKGRAGVRWISVVEKEWKDIGGNRGELMSAEKFGRYKTEIGKNDRNQGKVSAKKQGEIEI